MTTAVVIMARHAPVKVTRIGKSQHADDVKIVSRVEVGKEETFHVWDGSDLLIHEIQPGEVDATAGK